MEYLSLPTHPSNVDRHTWTAEDCRELALFPVQCALFASLSVLLYMAGPAVGLAFVAVGMLASSYWRRQTTRGKNELGGAQDAFADVSDSRR